MLSIATPKRLYLLRHAHTFDPQPDQCIPGQTAQLTEKGHAQAQALASFLHSSIRFNGLFSSALQRTHDTLQPLARMQNQPIIQLDTLNELPLRISPPVTYGAVIAAYQQLTQDLAILPYARIPLGQGKNFAQIWEGYLAALRHILLHEGTHLAVMGHGGTNMVLLCAMMGLPLHRMMAFYQENCCLNIIDCLPPDRFIIRLVNYTHQDALKTQASL